MNLIPGRWQRAAERRTVCARRTGRAVSAATAARGRRPPDDAAVTLGIRPEHLWLLEVQTAPPDAERRAGSERPRWWSDGTRRDDRVARVRRSWPRVVRSTGGPRRGPPAGRPRDGRRAATDGIGGAGAARGRRSEVGQEVAVGLDPSQVHLFDGRTGENLKATRPGNEKPAGRSRAGCEPQTEN